MLSIVEVSHFEDRIPFLKQDGIYIVSDIKSKLQFQKFLLQENSFIQESSITRANDFYCELLKINFPEYRLISIPELQFLFKDFIRKEKNFPYVSPSLYNNILVSLQSFLPFLSHPLGSEAFEQWIQRPHQKRWISWYSWIKPFWEQLKEEKIIEHSLAKYVLIDQPLKKVHQKLYVDLSFSIDAVEQELLHSISQQQDVYILCPPPLNPEIYPQSHKIYKLLKEKNHQFTSLPQKEVTPIKKEILKFPSMLEEIQFITQQLRKDLTQHSPSDLVVLAPDMESYWPILKSYLKKEGLPFSKGDQHSLLSYPQVQKWLSSIHFQAGNISYNNIEYVVRLQRPKESLSKIRSQYYYSDRRKDFDSSIKKEEQIHSDLMDSDSFLKWIFDEWSQVSEKESHEQLNQKIQSIGNQLKNLFSQKKQILVSDGLELLEYLLTQSNLHVSSENPSGISFMGVHSITSMTAQKIYIIGLDYHSCQAPSLSLFIEKEVHTILNDFGFYCHYLDPNRQEYEIINFLKFFKGKVSLSYSEAHFSGAPLHPSKSWLLENQLEKTPQPTFKDETAWTSIQKYRYSPLPEKWKASFEQNFKWPQSEKIPLKKLSASRIKDYASCPFIYLSKNIYQLKDDPHRDQQLSNRDRGHLVHELLSETRKGQIKTSEDVLNWIQKVKSRYSVLDEKVWSLHQEEFVKIFKKFIQNEQRISEILPEIQTLGTELEFEGYWNLENKKLSSTGDIPINGRIDRVDHYKGEYLILDYKSSLNTVKTIKSWKKNIDIQMPLYTQAIEANLLTEHKTPQSHVVSSNYVSLKNFEWKGFTNKHSEIKKIVSSRSRSLADTKTKETVLESINQDIQDYIIKIQENEFQPTPHDNKICDQCTWRKLCRAPHLNL